MLVSSFLIGYNKLIFYHWDFPFPLFLLSCHMFVSTVLTQVVAKYTVSSIPAVTNERIQLKNTYIYIIPLCICQTASMVLSNMSYSYLTVSYIQMIKTITIVLVLVMSYFSGLITPSTLGLIIIFLVVGGVAVASTGEAPHSMLGVQLQLCGVFAESVRLVLTDWLMTNTSMDPFSLFYYTSPICLGILVPACIYFELPLLPLDRILNYPFVLMIELNSILAFAQEIAVLLLISHTSALSLSICGVAKDILYLTCSALIVKTNHHATWLHSIGYGIALVGMVRRNYFQ